MVFFPHNVNREAPLHEPSEIPFLQVDRKATAGSKTSSCPRALKPQEPLSDLRLFVIEFIEPADLKEQERAGVLSYNELVLRLEALNWFRHLINPFQFPVMPLKEVAQPFESAQQLLKPIRVRHLQVCQVGGAGGH